MSGLLNNIDDYGFRHLVYHLAEASREAELFSLLTLEEGDGVNAWFHARDSRGETAAYVDDLQLARQLADDTAARRRGHRRAAAIGQQCRYALMRAALNDVAGGINPGLSARLVEAGVWTQEQALAYARLAESESRLQIIIGALVQEHGKRRDELAREALAIAQPLVENIERIGDIVVELAQSLPGGFVGELLGLLRGVTNEASRSKGLKALAPKLPPSLMPGALSIARDTIDPGERASVLAVLAANLPPDAAHQVFEEALDAARHLDERYDVLSELAYYLPLDLLPDLLSISDELSDDSPGDVQSAALGRYAEKDPRRVLEQLLAFDDNLRGRRWWEALDRVATALARDGSPQEALDAARAIPDITRGETLARLAAMVPIQARWPVLEEIGHLSESHQVEALEAIARNADDELGQAVLNAASQLDEGMWRVKALSAVALALPASLRDQALRIAFEAARARQDDDAFQKLAPALPRVLAFAGLEFVTDPAKYTGLHLSYEETVGALATRVAELGEPRRALDTVLSLSANHGRLVALSALALKLPADMLGEVRDAIESPHHEAKRLATSVAMARHLPPTVLEHIFDRACSLKDPVERIDGLISLTPWLPNANRSLGMEVELAAVLEIRYRNPDIMLGALDSILTQLPASLGGSAVDTVVRVKDPDARMSALVQVATQVDGTAANRAWRRVLKDTSRLRSKRQREERFVELAPLVPAGLHEYLLDRTKDLREDARATILTSIADCLSASLLERAITETRTMWQGTRLRVLGELLQYAVPATRRDVVDSEYAKLETDTRAEGKVWLFTAFLYLGPHDRSEARTRRARSVLQWVLHGESAADRAANLAILAGQAPGSIAGEAENGALTEAASVADEDLPPVLLALAYFMPPARLPEVARFAQIRLPFLPRQDSEGSYKPFLDTGDALGKLTLRASHAGQYETALTMLRLMEPRLLRDDVIKALIPMLPPGPLYRAAALTEEVNVLGEIAAQLNKRGAWDSSLLVIGDIVERYSHGWSSHYKPGVSISQIAQAIPAGHLDKVLHLALQLPENDQAQMLPAILDRLPRQKRRVVLEQVLSGQNAELLTALTDHLATLPARTVLQAWTKALRSADEVNGREILDQVRALGPVLASFGPDIALAIYHGLNRAAGTPGAGDTSAAS
jgi:hypothetical protein